MKKSTVLTLVLAFVGLVLLACSQKPSQNSFQSKEARVTQNQALVEESRYPGIGISKEEIRGDYDNQFISYPVFEADQLNQDMEDFIQDKKDDYQALADNLNFKDQGLTEDDKLYHNISFTIHPVTESVYSLVFDTFIRSNNTNPETHTKPLMVDTKAGAWLEAGDYFTDQGRGQFEDLVKSKLEEDLGQYFFEEYFEEKRADGSLYQAVYFTDHSIVVQFSQYEIAAGAAGAPKVSLGQGQVKAFLNDQGHSLLDQTTPDEDRNSEALAQEEAEDQNEGEETSDQEKDKKMVAFTFDDGPHPEYTDQILAILDQYDAKGTFFMLGNSVDFYPHVAKRVAAAGHEIGNHSFSHPDLTTLGSGQVQSEISEGDRAIEAATGQVPKYYRPPYGAHNSAVDNLAQKPAILWDVDTLDWQSRDPQAILQKVQEQTSDGAIILMHDIHQTTIEGFRLSIDYLADQGYEFGTVSELLAHKE